MKLSGSKKIVVCGLVSALCTAIIIMYEIIPVGMYILPAISGIIILAMAIEFGFKCGLEIFLITSVLSLMLSGDKSAAIFFIILFGYYPLLKIKIETLKLNMNIVKLAIKLAVFNLAIILEYWISIKLFGVPEESLMLFGIYMPHVLLIMANITFLMYDRCIIICMYVYVHKIRGKIFSKLKL